MRNIQIALYKAETTRPKFKSVTAALTFGAAGPEEFYVVLTNTGIVRMPGDRKSKFPQNTSIEGILTKEDMKALKTYINNLNL